MKLDQLDRELLSIIQAGLPVAREPFKELAESLGTTEGEVLARKVGELEAGARKARQQASFRRPHPSLLPLSLPPSPPPCIGRLGPLFRLSRPGPLRG